MVDIITSSYEKQFGGSADTTLRKENRTMKKINENELTMVAGGCPRPYVEPVPAPEERTLPFKPTPVVFDPDAITIV
jgi:hypothetical protein